MSRIPKKYSTRSKYNVKKDKPICDGIKFDSKLELNHYKYLNEHPNIEIVQFQPYFLLLEPFLYYDFETQRTRKYGKFSYKADFLIRVKGVDKLIVFESKGMVKPDFQIRRKMWYNKFGKEYYYITVKSLKQCKEIFDKY